MHRLRRINKTVDDFITRHCLQVIIAILGAVAILSLLTRVYTGR